MATATISPDFIWHVRQQWTLAIREAASDTAVRHGVNCFTSHAIPAYASSVAAVEAFVNEVFLADLGRHAWKGSPLWALPHDWVARLELPVKLILVPQLLIGQTFDSSTQPYQDMVLLVRVRNDLVHFKMGTTAPKYLSHLSERSIALTATSIAGQGDYPWPHKLSSSEGIRWAHNTACATVHALASLFRDKRPPFSLLPLASNFQPISGQGVLTAFGEAGIDVSPDERPPEFFP